MYKNGQIRNLQNYKKVHLAGSSLHSQSKTSSKLKSNQRTYMQSELLVTLSY